VHENLTWKLVAKKLHIVACELHHIYNIVYNIKVFVTTVATCMLTFKVV
jgi:hypothetical protein